MTTELCQRCSHYEDEHVLRYCSVADCECRSLSIENDLPAFHRGVNAAKDAIRSECVSGDDEGNYYRATCINAIARKCGTDRTPVLATAVAEKVYGLCEAGAGTSIPTLAEIERIVIETFGCR